MTQSQFFAGHKQRDVKIRQFKGKAPMFFPEVHMMTAVFTADLDVVRSWLPDKRYHPLKIGRRRGVAAIHCMEYRETDIGPYNEVSLSVGVHHGRLPALSPARLVGSLLTGGYHGYVKELPVNTEVSLYGGIDFFNFPKYLADISFRETADHRVCTVRDKETLDLILEVEGRKIRTLKPPSLMTLNSYPQKDGKTLHAKTMVNQRRWGRTFLLRNMTVRLGEHPRAQPFKELALGKQLEYLLAPSCEAILFMPSTV